MLGKISDACECDDCRDLGSNTARITAPHAAGSRLRNILRLLGIYAALITVVLVSCIIILECFAVVYKIPYVFSVLSCHVVGGFGVLFQICYTVLAVIVIVCVGRTILKLEKDKNSDTKSIHETALFEIAMLFAIGLYMIYIICYMVKVDIGTQASVFSEIPDWALMFDLLCAPVWEEIIFRVVLIGVPALIIALIMKKRDVPLRRYLTGGFGISKSAVFFIFLSSLLFGLAHIEAWGVWKFYPTFISGLMLGYLFVKYGFCASVVMHFLVDYMLVGKWLFGSMMIIDPLVVIIAIVAIPSVCLYVGRGATFFKNFTRRSKS